MKKLIIAALAAATIVAPAQAEGISGARAVARIGWETPTVSGAALGDVYKIGQAVSFGGEVGYDFKASDKVTVGPYAVIDFSGVEACDIGDCLKVKNTWGAGGRVGFGVGDNGVIYGKAGYAKLNIDANVGVTVNSVSKGGVQGGIGYEGGLSKSAFWMLEANYGDFGKIGGVNFQRRHVAAGVGFRF
jgi:outer membrane immunogenic protein